MLLRAEKTRCLQAAHCSSSSAEGASLPCRFHEKGGCLHVQERRFQGCVKVKAEGLSRREPGSSRAASNTKAAFSGLYQGGREALQGRF
jgi:hypothetical protein